MATKNDKTKVTRIKAADSAPAKKTARASAKQPTAPQTHNKSGALRGFFGYFKGAWVELRQVHWPTRRATWGLTGAVLLFSAFFVAFITALDAGFKFLFEQILQ